MARTKRPVLLEALCLLSFIGSGGAFLVYFTTGLFFDRLGTKIIAMSSFPDTPGLTHGYFIVYSLLFVISLTGVQKMWTMHRSGFVVYTLAQAAILAYPLFILGKDAFSPLTLILSLLFVVLYGFQLKFLTASTGDSPIP